MRIVSFGLTVALTLGLTMGWTSVAASATGPAAEAEVLERLAPALATEDPARIAAAFRAMGSYGEAAATAVEASIDELGERRLNEGDLAGAISAFRMNAETFPDSGAAWKSLADAVSAGGDHETGLVYARRADALVLRGTNASTAVTAAEPLLVRTASDSPAWNSYSSGARQAATISGWASSHAVASVAPSAICSGVMSSASCPSLYSAPE